MTLPGNRIFFKPCKPEFRLDQVTDAFSQFGPLREVKMLKGYGFVEFSKKEDASKALGTEVDLCGFKVTVAMANRIERREGPPPRSGRSSRPSDDDLYRVQLSGLNPDTKWKDLKDHFRKQRINVSYSEVSRSGDGTGLIDLESQEDVDYILDNMQGSELLGNEIVIHEDSITRKPREKDRRDTRDMRRNSRYDDRRGNDYGSHGDRFRDRRNSNNHHRDPRDRSPDQRNHSRTRDRSRDRSRDRNSRHSNSRQDRRENNRRNSNNNSKNNSHYNDRRDSGSYDDEDDGEEYNRYSDDDADVDMEGNNRDDYDYQSDGFDDDNKGKKSSKSNSHSDKSKSGRGRPTNNSDDDLFGEQEENDDNDRGKATENPITLDSPNDHADSIEYSRSQRTRQNGNKNSNSGRNSSSNKNGGSARRSKQEQKDDDFSVTGVSSRSSGRQQDAGRPESKRGSSGASGASVVATTKIEADLDVSAATPPLYDDDEIDEGW